MGGLASSDAYLDLPDWAATFPDARFNAVADDETAAANRR